MFKPHSHADPPATLTERVQQLNDNLQHLAVRVRDAIATVISRAVANAIRDALRAILGSRDEYDQLPDDDRFADEQGWDDREEDLWHQPSSEIHPASGTPSRVKDAVRAAAQAGLWWLRQQPGKHPVLTTTLVALAAGITAFIAGPTFAACVSVGLSVAGLLLTADSTKSAVELFAR